MIGVYDYTVILTYLSLISGTFGIIVTVTGAGHPQLGVFFLMLSGILDAFDGRVARTKKNRTEFDKNFGIQIDSLTDLVCFGILPVTIGLAQLRISGIFTELVKRKEYEGPFPVLVLLLVIALFYVLAAMIRLAYFNSTCSDREEEIKKSGKSYFVGVPVTSAALVFPLVLIAHCFTKFDLTIFYFVIMLVEAIAFVTNIKVRKPGKVGLTVIIFIGVAEFAACIMAYKLGIGQ